MAKYSVLYTLLPNGFAPDGKVRLSLVASPRPEPGKLSESDVFSWPELVIAQGTRFSVLTAGGGAPVEATVVSPRPDPALWAALFPGITPVRNPAGPLSGPLGAAAESMSYVEELGVIADLYALAMTTSPGSKMSADHPVMQRIAGLNAWRSGTRAAVVPGVEDLLDPKKITRERVRQAAALVGNEIVALVPRIRRLGLTAATGDNPPQGTPKPGPLDLIAPLDSPDFGQVVGALLRHPTLALLLGLRVDLTMPAFTGTRLIRLGDRNGNPLNGLIPITQPWSAVVSDPQARRFVMVTQPDDRAEIVNGMLDLRPGSRETSRYVVSDMDVVGIGQQLDILATRLSGQAMAESFGMPVRRTAGLTVAQTNRLDKFKHMLERNARFEGTPPSEVDGAPVLYADDVTTGYRVDVSANRGEFHSLMRRVASYTIGTGAGKVERVVHDEAQIEPFTLAQQHDNESNAHLFVGEELFGWTGWGFGGQLPGPAVGAETREAPHVVAVDPAPLPGYPFLVKTEVEPGTLEKLRFGNKYRFRARGVDLAGNSVDSAMCDPALVTEEAMYHRYEPVPPPVIVPRKPYGLGESPDQMVVYSDGDGNPLAPPSERHLAPPKTSQRMAELHGVFDEAFGPNATQSARDRVFELSKKEEGSFLDPAPGVAVVSTDPANPNPTTLPVPRGEPLAPGEYVIHDTATPLTPYLPDVVSSGPAFAGLPDVAGPLVLPWNPAGGSWPDRHPARLVLHPGTAATTTSAVQSGRYVVAVDLPPAEQLTIEVSSGITSDGLKVMDAPPAGTQEHKMALVGQIPLLSPRQPVTLVHAVRKPTVAPTMSDLDVDVTHPAGTTDVDVSANVTAHAPSTGRVAIEANWTEIVDRGYGPVKFEDHRITVASKIFARSDSTKQLAGKFDVGDSKRRVVTYRPVAVTRFQEYFNVSEADQRQLLRLGAEEVRNIAGRIRPKQPKVHSVVPIFQRHVVKGASGGKKFVEVTHGRKGVRVYLKRPWHDSGEGQLLGVVVPKNAATAATIAASSSLRDRVTRWGIDLYDQTFSIDPGYPSSAPLLPASFPGQAGIPTGYPDVGVPGLGSNSHLFTIVGHEVEFDAEKELWYADIPFSHYGLDAHFTPFLRLALVAYQPTSYGPAGNPGDLRSSTMTIADPIQLASTWRVRATGVDTVPSVSVMISDHRNFEGNWRFKIRWQARAIEPGVWPNPAPDICVDGPFVEPKSVIKTDHHAVSTVLLPLATANNAAREALRLGRLVIEEIQQGWSLNAAGQVEDRPAFTEVVEVKDLF